MCQASKCGLKHAAGRYGDTPTRCNSDLRARSSLTHTAFPGPTSPISLPLPFPRPPSPPTHQRRRRQAGASADPRYPWSLLSIAQTDRAILFARAMATSSRGFFAIIRPSHDPWAAPLRAAHRTTAMAPMISRRRMSRCPIFDVRPSLGFPPVVCCRGTRPSQAAKSRPPRR